MKSQPVEPNFGVANGAKHVRPRESLVASSIAVGCEAGLDEGSFVVGEKFRCCRVVGDKKVGHQGDNDCQETFDDEDPPPTIQTPNTSHVRNSVGKYTYAQRHLPVIQRSSFKGPLTSKGSRKSCGGEEQRDPVVLLITLVPHGKVEHDACTV